MRASCPSLVLALLILSSRAIAGPNAGGVIMLHANESLVASTGLGYCGQSGLESCEAADVRVDGVGSVVFYVIAAFPPEASPRLAGLTLGIEYDATRVLVETWGVCGDFELHLEDWPASGSGTAITWFNNNVQTKHVVEVLWFQAYSYSEDPSLFSIINHPTGGSLFADDDVPSVLDVPIDFGSIGFNTDGHRPCPTVWDCTLHLTPPAITVYQPCEGSFPVDLEIHDVEDLWRFDLCVGYDDAFLNFTSRTIDESFLESSGRTVSPHSADACIPDCEPAGVRIGAHTDGTGEGASGSGRLAEIRFSPQSAAAAENSICLDADGLDLGQTTPQNGPIYIAAVYGAHLTHSPFCFGDFNGDGDVTVFDLARNIPKWGCCAEDACYDAAYDVNLLEAGNYCASTPDGCIDVVDIQRVAGRWHLGCVGGAPQPERPASAFQSAIPSVRISPEFQLISGNPGDPASVELLVDNTTDLGAFAAEVSFDPAVFQVASVVIGDFLRSTPRTAYNFAPQIDNTSGTVRFGACTVGTSPGATGSGDLAQIVFEIQDCGATTEIAFQSVTLTFSDGEPQELGPAAGGSIQIVCTSSAPTLPTLSQTTLFPSRPNPVSAVAEISFYVHASENASLPVDLAIFDTAGRLVRTLVHERLDPGTHLATWDTRDRSGNEVPNGAYFSRLLVAERSFRKQIVIAR